MVRISTELDILSNTTFNGNSAVIGDATNGLTFHKATSDTSDVLNISNDSGK